MERFERGEAFGEQILLAPTSVQPELNRLYEWAESMQQTGLVKLECVRIRHYNLQIREQKGNSLLAKVCIQSGRECWIYLNAPKFRDVAPNSIPLLSKLTGKDFSTVRRAGIIPTDKVSSELLAALTAAYREANGLFEQPSEPEYPNN